MADAIRSVSELQALFPNNTTGEISPQDLRDFLLSAAPSYAELYRNVAAATTISVAGTYYKAAGTTTLGAASDFDMPLDNRLRYTGAANRIAHIICDYSMTTAGSNDVIGAQIAINGVAQPESVTRRLVGTGTDIGAASSQLLVQLSTNDYIEVFVTNEDATATVTLDEFTLVAVAHLT